MNNECCRGMPYGIQTLFRLTGSKKQGLVFGATQHSCTHQPCSRTKHRPPAKEVPSAGASLFAYFFGVVKSMASDGTRPVGLDFDFRLDQKSKGQQIHNLLPCTFNTNYTPIKTQPISGSAVVKTNFPCFTPLVPINPSAKRLTCEAVPRTTITSRQ